VFRVPGPRPIDLIQSVDLPWREVIDCSEHVDSYSSYKKSLELCRNGLLCGPSSGLAFVGLLKYLQHQKQVCGLDKLRDESGTISCKYTHCWLSILEGSYHEKTGAFIVCDLPYQYIGEYVSKLGESAFPPIHNPELLGTDIYSYGIDWKISAKVAWRKVGLYRAPMTPPSSPIHSEVSTEEEGKPLVLIDLREPGSTPALHAPNVQSFSICSESTSNPFSDPPTLAHQWKLMDTHLGVADTGALGKGLVGKVVILFCYNGNTASVGASVLRSRGVEAFWVEGGAAAWSEAAGR
jgi:rhodanese-related sulfurtransferase